MISLSSSSIIWTAEPNVVREKGRAIRKPVGKRGRVLFDKGFLGSELGDFSFQTATSPQIIVLRFGRVIGSYAEVQPETPLL